MDREEARRECERLRREHPERATHTWIPREVDGGWQIVRAPLPPGMRRDPLKATTEAKPKPAQSDDAPPWHSAGGVPPYAAG
jgi:hypothetical protein